MNPHPTASSAKILIVDDAPETVQLIEAVLSRAGNYEFAAAATGKEAIERARSFDPDVVTLDLGLPGTDGVEVCRELRTFTDAYVLMLTGRDDEVDRLVGLAVGADDYMTKPFSSRELAARIQVLLRRPRGGVRATSDQGTITFGDLSIDQPAREVRVEGQIVQLTKTEFDVLATLARRPQMVFTREFLVQEVWGDSWVGDDHMVSVHVANLRKKIDHGEGSYIKTIRGVGYRIESQKS